jgi:hypothetical protein
MIRFPSRTQLLGSFLLLALILGWLVLKYARLIEWSR